MWTGGECLTDRRTDTHDETSSLFEIFRMSVRQTHLIWNYLFENFQKIVKCYVTCETVTVLALIRSERNGCIMLHTHFSVWKYLCVSHTVHVCVLCGPDNKQH